MKIPSVKELRQRGFKVFVKHVPHERRYSKYDYSQLTEGMVEVEIIPPGGKKKFFSQSFRSLKDTPNRKLGVRIALGRAFKYMKQNCDLDIVKEL